MENRKNDWFFLEGEGGYAWVSVGEYARVALCPLTIVITKAKRWTKESRITWGPLYVFLIAGSMPVQYLALPEGVVKSGCHPYLLAFTHIRLPQNSHESMPVWHRGRGETYKPSTERAIASSCPWPSSLAPFRSPPPPVSRTRVISCPPHWWRAADIARAYLLKGLPWRLAVVVRQSWSQKEREEEERVIHLLQRESRRRDLKKRKGDHKHGIRSCYLVNGFQLVHLGETSIPSSRRGFA